MEFEFQNGKAALPVQKNQMNRKIYLSFKDK